MIDPNERAALMVEAYGEVCTKAQAARILRRGPTAIRSMLADGRLDAACEGEMVDVRSIARYIAAPKQADEAARQRRIKLRHNSEWAV